MRPDDLQQIVPMLEKRNGTLTLVTFKGGDTWRVWNARRERAQGNDYSISGNVSPMLDQDGQPTSELAKAIIHIDLADVDLITDEWGNELYRVGQ
jgi:hypothetical protein